VLVKIEYMKLICINCNCDFEKPQEQKTCSRKCSDELKKKNNREERTCIMCSKIFEVKKITEKTMCSDVCRQEYDKIPENRANRMKKTEEAVIKKYGVKSTLQLDEVKEKIKLTKLEKYGDENFVNYEKAKETNLEKYGVEHSLQVKEIRQKGNVTKKELYGDENYNNREKAAETMKDLYGVQYAIQNENFQQKQQETNLERYGVRFALQNEEIKIKAQETNLERYGVKFITQNEEIKTKIKDTNLEKYGVTSHLAFKEVRDKGKEVIFEKYGTYNPMSLDEVKDKRKKNNLKKYGVDHPMKLKEVLEKNHLSGLRIHKYKNTSITYQGSYEKYFLELLEEKGLLNEVTNGKSYDYIFEEKQHVYHTDFSFKGKQIEIKSGWTYNNNGKNLKLQEINEAKWESVRKSGEAIVILINKSEITGFVKALQQFPSSLILIHARKSK